MRHNNVHSCMCVCVYIYIYRDVCAWVFVYVVDGHQNQKNFYLQHLWTQIIWKIFLCVVFMLKQTSSCALVNLYEPVWKSETRNRGGKDLDMLVSLRPALRKLAVRESCSQERDAGREGSTGSVKMIAVRYRTFVVYWPLTPPNMPFQRWRKCIFHWCGWAWLTIWDRVKIPWYSHKLMHQKRVTCELHDSYFRSVMAKHAIPKTAEVHIPLVWTSLADNSLSHTTLSNKVRRIFF